MFIRFFFVCIEMMNIFVRIFFVLRFFNFCLIIFRFLFFFRFFCFKGNFDEFFKNDNGEKELKLVFMFCFYIRFLIYYGFR